MVHIAGVPFGYVGSFLMLREAYSRLPPARAPRRLAAVRALSLRALRAAHARAPYAAAY